MFWQLFSVNLKSFKGLTQILDTWLEFFLVIEQDLTLPRCLYIAPVLTLDGQTFYVRYSAGFLFQFMLSLAMSG